MTLSLSDLRTKLVQLAYAHPLADTNVEDVRNRGADVMLELTQDVTRPDVAQLLKDISEQVEDLESEARSIASACREISTAIEEIRKGKHL